MCIASCIPKKAVEVVNPDAACDDPKAPCPQKTAKDLALELIDTEGTADAQDAALVADELAKLPKHILQRLKDKGVKVKVCRGSITEYRTDLKGVQPRGWPAGMTWDSVPGVYNTSKKEVVIATVGHGTDAGAHVPAKGEGHGSQNLVIHESMHAVDKTSDDGPLSDNEDFTNARNADATTLSAYESQAGGAGREETFAESAARYYGGDSDDATNHPKLHEYWDSDPLKPNP